MRERTITVLLIIMSIVLCVVTICFFELQFVAKNDSSDSDWFKYQKTNYRNENFKKQEDEVIVVGVYDAGYLYHNSHEHGISTDIISELFFRLELKCEILVMPRARVSSMIEEGSIPVGFSSIETPERAEYSYFIPYFEQKNEVIVRADANATTEEEFFNNKNLKFGVVRGYYYGEYYEEMIEKLKQEDMVVEAKDIDDLYKMLDANWIQATVNNAASYQFYLEFYKIGEVELYDWAPQQKLLVRNISFSKKYFKPEDIEAFQDTIDQMREDGTIYSIFNNYLSKEDIERTCRF